MIRNWHMIMEPGSPASAVWLAHSRPMGADDSSPRPVGGDPGEPMLK